MRARKDLFLYLFHLREADYKPLLSSLLRTMAHLLYGEAQTSTGGLAMIKKFSRKVISLHYYYRVGQKITNSLILPGVGCWFINYSHFHNI